MAIYYQNDNGTTTEKKYKSKGNVYIQRGDGSTVPNKNYLPSKKKIKERNNTSKSFLQNVADFGIGTLKTAGNIATNMGEGALRTLEGGLDFLNSAADSINNPLQEKTEILTGISTKKEAKKNRLKQEESQRKFISRDLTNEFQEKTGFNEIQKDWEKGSLVKENNIGGQIAQGIGGMVPSLVVGNLGGKALGGVGELASASTKGLSTGKKILATAKNVGKAAIQNAPANTMLTTSVYGQSLQEAYQNGATDEEAKKYALGSSATELATEWVTGGIPGIESTGFLDKAADKLINKATGKISNKLAKDITKTIIKAGYEAVGEGVEEGISEIVSPLLKNATYSKDEKVNWNDVFQSAIVGGITGGILNVPSTMSDFKNNIKENNSSKNIKATLPTGLNQNLNNSQQSVERNPLLNNNTISMPLDKNTANRINNSNNISDVGSEAQNIDNNVNILQDAQSQLNSQNNVETQTINQNNILDNKNIAYEYISSPNQKIDNLRRSANQFLNNSDTSKSFIETAEKVIKDKDYNIVLDNSLKTENGNDVNARIRTLENGETEIRINPNSDRAGEFLLTHEITHAIETNDMVDIVMDYASKNKAFNTSLENLKQTYGTEKVSSEVLADISGQLFGNEEFINTLSMNKPNIFKRIYDSIISLANKITGNSRESLFIKELQSKWEKAYRNNDNSLNESNYSILDKFRQKNESDKSTIKELSKESVLELQEKTRNNQKNKDSVEFVSIDKILPYKTNGGYRTEEQVLKLANNIMANGIITPIEITKNQNGEIEIYNGNHRLEIAEKLGLKEVPIEYNGHENIENVLNSSYNKNIRDFYEGEEDGNFTGTKKFEKGINKSKSNTRYSLTDSQQSSIESGISRDGGLPTEMGRYNDGTSSDTTLRENNQKQEQELENRSFSLANNPENKNNQDSNKTWRKFIEDNYKSGGTKSYFEDMRSKEKITPGQSINNKKIVTIHKQYENNKSKTKKIMTKEVSKILQFSDYKTKQKFQDLISEYYDNPNYNQIKQDIIDNFSEQKTEYINEEIKEIKKNIRNTDLKIDNYIKNNLADYDFFRKSNFNKLKLKKEGQSIDSFYTELSEMYPSVFSKDINNEVDQLYRLSEFMNEDNRLVEKYNLDDNVINEATKFIYYSLMEKENIDDLINDISISPKEIRKERTIQYREEAADFIKNSTDWKDKKSGLSYKINTMKRNFYDIMPNKDANRLYSNYIEPIFRHNAEMQKDIDSYNKKINKLKLNEKDSQAVQMLGEYKYNPDTMVTGAQIDEFISINNLDYDKISKAVEEFRKLYDELFDRTNLVLKSQGYKEIEYRKGYFPHFIDDKPSGKFGKMMEKLGWKFKDNAIPTSIAGITEQFKPGKVWTSFSQQRKGKITDYNALKGFDNYIRGAMQNIYFTEDIQKLRALENEIRYQHSDKGIQSKIDEIYDDDSLTFEDRQDKIEKIYATYLTPLNNFVTELRDYTNGIANKKSGLDRTVEALSNRKFYNVMDNVSNRLSANMVGMNLGSAITNFIPITQAASQIKSQYLLKGLKEAIKNQYSVDGFDNKSVFLTSRLNEAERLYKTKLEKISEKMNFMFEGIDSITSNTIVRAKYYENRAKGMSEFNSIRNADEFARDLMAGRTKGEMPTAFNSKNPLIKMFTSFQLEVNNQFGYMLKDLPRDLNDETKKKLVSAFIKMFVGAWIYNQLTEKIVGRKAAFSPIDTIKEVYDTTTSNNLKIKDKSTDILENLTQDIPFVGGLVGGGRLPISSISNPLKILKGESTPKEEIKKLGYYTMLPFGGGQLKKTIEGASMYINNKDVKGSYTNKGDLRFEASKDPLSIVQNVLFGQYSSKEARDYFKNRYAPIDKKTLKKIKDKNLTINEYRDYENKYKSIKNKSGKKLTEIKSDKTSDGKSITGTASGKKAYLIMKSNFSNKEKDYMLSKLSTIDDYPKVKDLEKLSVNEDIYKLYYSMDINSRKEFNRELRELRISSDELYNYYMTKKEYSKKYVAKYSKEKIIDYLQASKFDEKTKWYFYNKDYGNDNLKLIVNTFNIKSTDYFNTMRYANKVKSKYSNEKQAKLRKNMIYEYINKMNLSSKQKIILFKQAGYTPSSEKKSMYNYINNLKLSRIEKEQIWNAIY